MDFNKAITYMKKGKKVTLKGKWLKHDYLYIEDKIIYCDGGFPFLHMLRDSEIRSKKWTIYKQKEVKNEYKTR